MVGRFEKDTRTCTKTRFEKDMRTCAKTVPGFDATSRSMFQYHVGGDNVKPRRYPNPSGSIETS